MSYFWGQISCDKIVVALNVSIFMGLQWIGSVVLKNLIYKSFFPYYSVGLIINSIVIFCIFAKLRIKYNRGVNIIATGTLGVYLFQSTIPFSQYRGQLLSFFLSLFRILFVNVYICMPIIYYI